jgi:hypothetical protein
MRNSRAFGRHSIFLIDLIDDVFVNDVPNIVTSVCLESGTELRHKAARKKPISPKQWSCLVETIAWNFFACALASPRPM